MWLHALTDAEARCGGKATQLAALIRAGVPVPEGFALDDRAFRHVVGASELTDETQLGHALAAAAERISTAALPPELVRDVEHRAAALGVLAVRSSATIEDGVAGAAAGVFSSRRAVAATEVWDAIRAVWASALTPLAATYARRRGGEIAIGVIVQRFVDGERLTVYTRPPGGADRDELLVQRGDQLTRVPRPPPADHPEHPVASLALAAEAAITADHGADVELIESSRDGAATRWVVQARPIVVAPVHVRAPMPPAVLAPLRATGRTWRWDGAHNPDPLSPSQVGLVERVERAACAPWSMRVCAGFLFTAPRPDAPPPPRAPDTSDLLAARADELEAAIAASLELDDEDANVPSLDTAIARYLAFYRIWASELAPLITAARARAATRITRAARPSSVEATLLAAARGELDDDEVIARLGVLSPAWDVAVPTYGEAPDVLRAAVARARTVVRPDAPPRADSTPATSDERYAELVADLAERDDRWFARAQALVRRALLARARQLEIDPDDVCWIPLDEIVAAETLDRDEVHRRAAAARAAAARASEWAVPVEIGGDAPSPRPGERLLGTGTGPTVTGRVVRLATLASAVTIGHGDVVVARSITPALAVTVIGCAALVSETGGLLDHGAALARELGIPCVVGCQDAWSTLVDGELVSVDGDAGRVTIVGR